MTSAVLPLLNSRSEIRNHIGDFIESFVAYYGEESRQDIEKAFSNVSLFAFINPDNLDSLFSTLKQEITQEIIEKYRDSLPANLELKDLFGDVSFEFSNIMPLGVYSSFTKIVKDDPDCYLSKFSYNEMEPLLVKMIPSITYETLKDKINSPEFESLNKLLILFEEMLREYNERIKEYQPLSDQIETIKEEKRRLDKKYHVEFIKENADLLTSEELDADKRYIEGDGEYVYSDAVRHTFGYGITSTLSLECFSEESEKILQDESQNSWRKEIIMEERVAFFKSIGIDLGDDYERYLQSEEAKKRWPSFERIGKLKESKKKLENAFNIAYYSNTPGHLSMRQEIDSLGLENKDDSFDATLYTRSSVPAFVSPNFKKGPNGYELHPLLAANCSRVSGYIDHFLVHELNHVLELHVQSINYPNYQTICGWDIIDSKILSTTEDVDTIDTDVPKRKYEMFNEIMNEYIAQEISKGMQERGTFVFDTKDNATYINTTSYESFFFLIDEFFQEFKKEILASRRHGNIDAIWNAVGKENFEALNDIISEYCEHFSAPFALHKLFESIKKGEETEDTKYASEMRNRRIEVLEKMRMHYMLHTPQVQETEQKKESSL